MFNLLFMVCVLYVVVIVGMMMVFILVVIVVFKLLCYNYIEDRIYYIKVFNLSMIVGFINIVFLMIVGDLFVKFLYKV